MRRCGKMLVLALVFAGLLAACARGGPLRLLQPGGNDSSITGTTTYSESDLDLEKPAFLLDRERGSFSVTKEFESGIDQTKNGKTEYLLTSKKNKLEFFYPFNKSKKFKSAYACDRFESDTKFISDTKIAGTALYARGKGSSNAFAQQIGPLRLGYFVNYSRDRGGGVSEEISGRIESLSPDAAVLLLLKAKSSGWQVGARLGKRVSVSYLRTDEDITAQLNFVDADDNFKLPGNITGGRTELSFDYDVSPVWRVSAAYNHSALGNLDAISYNETLEIGRWLSSAEYKLKGLYVVKTGSAKHSWRAGIEDYSGKFNMAGTIDIFGASANFISGFYLYHLNGYLDRRTLRYGCGWSKGNYSYKLGYAYSWGNAYIHADTSKQQFFTYTPKLDLSEGYRFREHQLGLGVEKRIFKDTAVKYTLFQDVPLLKKDRAPAAAAAGGGGPVIKKKVRGGTLQVLTVQYLF